MNQKDMLNESSEIVNSDIIFVEDVHAMTPTGLGLSDPISSCSGELSEYMTRIHNRRTDKSVGDDMHDNSEINSTASRQNWGLDNECSLDRWQSGSRQQQQQQGRQQQDYQYMPSILSGKGNSSADSGFNEYGYSSNQRNIQREQRQQNEKTPLMNEEDESQSRSFSSQKSRKRKDASASDVSYARSSVTLGDIEDGEESHVDADGEEGDFKSQNKTGSVGLSRVTCMVGEDEYNPEEAVDNEGRFKMEEDEAELLLAALGGRKH